jgi:hypothetical protein
MENPVIRGLRLFALLSVAAALSACVSTKPTRMAMPQIVNDTRADTVLIGLYQREIQVDKPDVNGGGGLLGALIEGIAESTMDKNRQKALSPIRDAAVEFDFERQYVEMLKNSLPKSLVREDAKYVISRDIEDYQNKSYELSGRNSIFMGVRYAFDQNFNMLYVDASIGVGDNGWTRNKKGQLVSKYKSEKDWPGKVAFVGYSSYFPIEKFGGYEAGAAIWGANRGERLTKSLSVAVAEISDLINRDLASPLNATESMPKANVRFPGGVSLKGYRMETKGNRTLYAIGSKRIWTTDPQKSK